MPADRRAHPRQPADRPVVVRLPSTGAGVYWTARLRDTSAGGLGLLFDIPLGIGTTLVVELEEDGHETVPVRVVHATPLGDDWLLGCQRLEHPAGAEGDGQGGA